MTWRRFILWGTLAGAVIAGVVVAFLPQPVSVESTDIALPTAFVKRTVTGTSVAASPASTTYSPR